MGNLPTKNYEHKNKTVGNKRDLGLMLITTDDSIEGYALMGLRVHPASLDALYSMRFPKLILMGQNPLEQKTLGTHRLHHSKRAAKSNQPDEPATYLVYAALGS